MSELLHRYGEAMERKRLADEAYAAAESAKIRADRAVSDIAAELSRLLLSEPLASSCGEQRA